VKAFTLALIDRLERMLNREATRLELDDVPSVQLVRLRLARRTS
jgi:hypothetical protein